MLIMTESQLKIICVYREIGYGCDAFKEAMRADMHKPIDPTWIA